MRLAPTARTSSGSGSHKLKQTNQQLNPAFSAGGFPLPYNPGALSQAHGDAAPLAQNTCGGLETAAPWLPSFVATVRNMAVKQPSLLSTRRSLVERLADWDDQLRWQEFFDTYSKLIYSAARQSGLTDAEAQEVVQETVITVAKSIDKLKYDPAIGSFKGWLLQITRWRIADQFRKREPGNAKLAPLSNSRATATIERVPDSRGVNLDAVWETEWKENLFEAAIARVKKQIEPKQFQIFDCYVRKEWPAQKVAARLGVNIGQVYLARHRIGALLKREVKALERSERNFASG
jgi:RNA polymerase sigma factor (sigma-70 family)